MVKIKYLIIVLASFLSIQGVEAQDSVSVKDNVVNKTILVAIRRHKGDTLTKLQVEVGHLFNAGRVYAEAMNSALERLQLCKNDTCRGNENLAIVTYSSMLNNINRKIVIRQDKIAKLQAQLVVIDKLLEKLNPRL